VHICLIRRDSWHRQRLFASRTRARFPCMLRSLSADGSYTTSWARRCCCGSSAVPSSSPLRSSLSSSMTSSLARSYAHQLLSIGTTEPRETSLRLAPSWTQTRTVSGPRDPVGNVRSCSACRGRRSTSRYPVRQRVELWGASRVVRSQSGRPSRGYGAATSAST
jgi:hypothetical protein